MENSLFGDSVGLYIRILRCESTYHIRLRRFANSSIAAAPVRNGNAAVISSSSGTSGCTFTSKRGVKYLVAKSVRICFIERRTLYVSLTITLLNAPA